MTSPGMKRGSSTTDDRHRPTLDVGPVRIWSRMPAPTLSEWIAKLYRRIASARYLEIDAAGGGAS